MSQHDYVIANDSGASVRADLNSALQAILSQNSGTSEPSSTSAGTLWLDTTGGSPYALKIRDAGNNHWITLTSVNDPGSDSNAFLPAQINLPTSGGVFESDGSTEILTESSGAVTLKNTTIDGTVSMASSGVTVRNITNVALPSDQLVSNTTTVTTVFSPTYTPLFSGSKVQGFLQLSAQAEAQTTNARKAIKLEFTGSGITDITMNSSNMQNFGNYDFGGSGVVGNAFFVVASPLLTTSTTDTITMNLIVANMQSASTSYINVTGNGSSEQTSFTWIEYK